VRYIEGKPAIIADDYFDESIVRGTELAGPEDTTREDILAEAGYGQVYDIDEIITRMPTPRRSAGSASRRHQPLVRPVQGLAGFLHLPWR
jgi:hypothetical protein